MKTYHDGAQAERVAWLKAIRRLIHRFGTNWALQKMHKFGQERVKRYRKRKGGL